MRFDVLFSKLLEGSAPTPPDVRKQILSRIANGDTKAQIARDAGVNWKTVHRVSADGTELSPNAIKIENRKKKIIELTFQKKSNIAIANELGVSPKQIQRDKEDIGNNLSKYNLKEPLPVYSHGSLTGSPVQPPDAETNKPETIATKPELGSFSDFYNANTQDTNSREYATKGKLYDRYESFNIIRPYISKKSEINVLSLPDNYLFEQSLLNTFNYEKINVYGFDLKGEEDKQMRYARDIYKNSNHRIVPHIHFGNINRAIINGSSNFITVGPHKTYGFGFFRDAQMPTEGFDIIDLDYKKFPGTIPDMRFDNNTNPWFGPVDAAQKFLKPGGIVMVTYLAHTPRTQEKGVGTFYAMTKNPGNKMDKYRRIKPNSIPKNFYFNDFYPSKQVLKSFANRPLSPKDTDTRLNPGGLPSDRARNYYMRSAINSNRYTQNILAYAEEKNIKLTPIWVNIYPGGVTSYMYRAIFVKG